MSVEMVQGGGNIYKAIPAIMAEIGSIGKDRNNASQGYKYRGIEDFYNVCQPLMVRHKVFSVSEILEQSREERQTKSGGTLISTILKMRYRFYADDGSSVTTEVMGEGMDSGDKASNKAMAVAHKYALAQMFAVPTQDMVDPEVDSPEPAPKAKSAPNGLHPVMAQALAAVAPKPDPIVTPAFDERVMLEKEIGRLATILGADSITAARTQVAKLREDAKAGTLAHAEHVNKLREFRISLESLVADKQVM